MARIVLDHPDEALMRRVDAAVAAGLAPSREQFVYQAVVRAVAAADAEAARPARRGKRAATEEIEAAPAATEKSEQGSTATPLGE